jgi:hypothetical protein
MLAPELHIGISIRENRDRNETAPAGQGVAAGPAGPAEVAAGVSTLAAEAGRRWLSTRGCAKL